MIFYFIFSIVSHTSIYAVLFSLSHVMLCWTLMISSHWLVDRFVWFKSQNNIIRDTLREAFLVSQ